MTVWNGMCLKIKFEYFSLDLKPSFLLSFSESLSLDDVPMPEIYLTSEDNAYGIIYGEWPDGEFLGLKLGVTENSKLVRIRPTKQVYLATTCKEASFYESFGIGRY